MTEAHTGMGTSDSERLARLEVSVEGLIEGMRDIKATLKAKSQVPWMLILASATTLGAAYGAVVAPMQRDIARLEASAIGRESRVYSLETSVALVTAANARISIDINGLPAMESRLKMLEQQQALRGNGPSR